MTARLEIQTRKKGGWVDRSSAVTAIRVRGEDRGPFLDNLVTQNIKSLPDGGGIHTALLKRNSKFIAEFHLFKLEGEILLLVDRDQEEALFKTLDRYLFAERVELERLGDIACFYVQGPNAPRVFRSLLSDTSFEYQKNRGLKFIFKREKGYLLGLSLTGDDGFYIILPVSKKQEVADALREFALLIVEGNEDIYNILRIEAGIPRFGRDMDENTLVLEADPHDELIGSDQGCYPGQETVARVQSRGQVQKKLMGIKWKEGEMKQGDTLYLQGKPVAWIRSTCHSPNLGASIALAYLTRPLWFPRKTFRLERRPGDFRSRVVVTVERLPFYWPQAHLEKAEIHLKAGLDLYHADDYSKAREEFLAATEHYPFFSEAIEGLAVIAEREGDMDQAIELNKKFASLDSNAVMARTNLSRLYMKKGWIERAEEEQKKATLLGFKEAADEAAHQKNPEEIEEIEQRAREKKVETFRKVLELDPEDEIAHFGLGKLYYEEKNLEESVSHLKAVIDRNPLYSAAYDILGKALIGIGRIGEARDSLEKGIRVARDQGDLTPMKSMEEQRRKIDPKAASSDGLNQ